LRRAGILASLLALTLAGYAQVERGTITGSVTDAKGSAVPDATVRVVEEATNQSVELQTDSAGEYTASNLTPGAYTIRSHRSSTGERLSGASDLRTLE
jgi:protocatechuate 3,4-dioxygenase beta subunit